MQISSIKFQKKYGVGTAVKVPAARLAYIARFGYTEDSVLTSKDLIDLEYLDAIECLLAETAERIDKAITMPSTIEVITKPLTMQRLDDAEEVLFPILALYSRMLIHLDFAEVRLQPFFKKRATYCTHKWAETLRAACIEFRSRYTAGQETLLAFMHENLSSL